MTSAAKREAGRKGGKASGRSRGGKTTHDTGVDLVAIKGKIEGYDQSLKIESWSDALNREKVVHQLLANRRQEQDNEVAAGRLVTKADMEQAIDAYGNMLLAVVQEIPEQLAELCEVPADKPEWRKVGRQLQRVVQERMQREMDKA